MSGADLSFIGRKFGKLTVLQLDHLGDRNRRYWLCKCDCGEKRIVRQDHLVSGITTRCRKCAAIRRNLVGERFGRLTVIGLDRRVPYDDIYWLCECDCGNLKIVRQSNLIRGTTKSCGCLANERKGYSHDLTGQRFGRWRVLEFSHIDDKGKTYWLCECDCGTIKPVATTSLTSNKSKSCGCYSIERRIKHGGSYSRLYRIWKSMKNRCTYKNDDSYYRYGARGITICQEWNNFTNFQEWALNNGYSDDLTIDRIDNDIGYCPTNCRWVNNRTQGNNRSTNHRITYHDETHTIAEWSRLLRIKYPTLYTRIERGDMRDFKVYFNEKY